MEDNEIEDIRDFFVHVLDQSPSFDIAESEFRRALVDSQDLRRQYRAYCREQGTSERAGFAEFAEEYISEKAGKWNALNDYDEIE